MTRQTSMDRQSTDDFRFSTPVHLAYDFLKFDSRDLYWLATATMITLTLSQLHPVYFVTSAVLTLVSMMRTSNSRVYESVIRNSQRFIVKRFAGGMMVDETKIKTRLRLPYDQIVTVRDPKTGVEVISMLKLGGGSYGVLIVGDGAETPSQGRRMQSVRAALLGRQLRQIVELGVGWVMQVRPWNPWPFNKYKANAIHDRAYMPKSPIDPDTPEDAELVKYGRFLNEVLRAKEAVLHQRGRDSIKAVPLVMAGNSDLDKAKGTISYTLLKRSPIVSKANKVLKYLRRYGVPEPRIASESELVAYVRATWDRYGLPGETGYYKQSHDGKAGLAKFTDYLPRNIVCHSNCLEIDGNYVAILRARELPEMVEPGWLNRAFSVLDDDGIPINMTTATIGSVVSKRGESLSLGQLIPARRMLERRYMRTDFRSSGNLESHRQAVARERELGANQRRMQDFLVIQVVFADNREDLELYLDNVYNVAEDLGLNPYRVTDPRSMWDCLWASNGFGRL